MNQVTEGAHKLLCSSHQSRREGIKYKSRREGIKYRLNNREKCINSEAVSTKLLAMRYKKIGVVLAFKEQKHSKFSTLK
jgi:hypothetical protein